MTEPREDRAARPRRRAVGPPGAQPGRPVDALVAEPPEPDAPPVDDDARLLADVPPHHGT